MKNIYLLRRLVPMRRMNECYGLASVTEACRAHRQWLALRLPMHLHVRGDHAPQHQRRVARRHFVLDATLHPRQRIQQHRATGLADLRA